MEESLNNKESLIKKKILIIDDESIIGLSCKRILQEEYYEVIYEQNPKQGLVEAMSGEYDLILLDLIMPEIEGMEILKRIKSTDIRSDVIIITGYATIQTAVEAIKLGASDYVSKPFLPEELKLIINKVFEHSELVKENISLKKELEIHEGIKGILSDDPKIKEIFTIIKRVAPTEGTVCITGESGTGKELVAQAIHRLSLRKNKAFITCDCSSLAPSLLESELFGHIKGSFTGAISTKQGLFETANNGTLFLDEISNISLEIQSKLLRVLETRRMRKVGDTSEHEINIRLVTASNHDLFKMVEEKTFREDLYYRLQVIPIHLPPLRERKGDIIKLANYFLSLLRKNSEIKARLFAPESITIMENYDWPGNIRELKNMVERLGILCDSEVINPRHLPNEIISPQIKLKDYNIPITWEEFKKFKLKIQNEAVMEIEKHFLLEALKHTNGNISKAAKNIGIQRTNFHSLLRKYNINSNIKNQT